MTALAVEPELISVKQGTQTVKPADSVRPSLSDDGQIIAFESGQRLTIDDRNKIKDIYVYDRGTKLLRRIVTQDPLRKNGGPSVSGDGGIVAFHSYAAAPKNSDIPLRSDLGVFVRESGDVLWPLSSLMEKDLDGETLYPLSDKSGNRFLFTSNSTRLSAKEGFGQIYVLDRHGKAVLLSHSAKGEPANRPCGFPRMSDDGKQVAYLSAATNLGPGLPADNLTFHIYWLDRSLGTVERLDLFEKGFDPNEWLAGAFDMDADGSMLVFEAHHRDLNDPYKTLSAVDLFMYDRDKDCVTLLTMGLFADKSRSPSLSADGRFLAFITNGDVVVHDFKTDRWQLMAMGRCENPVISKNGHYIAFERQDKAHRNVYVVANSFYEGK